DPDPLGRVIAEHTPDGKVHAYEYDLRGRLATVTVGDQVQTFSYDENGNLIRRAAGAGGTVTLEEHHYDGLDRPETITHANGGETHLSYTSGGHLASAQLVDPRVTPSLLREYREDQ